MTADGEDTSRTQVRTYVPAYQKSEWESHADELDMSQSEFVRTMVQAGRRDFAVDPEKTEDSDTNPPGQAFEDRVLDVLSREGPKPWDELVEALVDDVEEQLDEALAGLQEQNRIRYSGRDGGYTLVEGQR